MRILPHYALLHRWPSRVMGPFDRGGYLVNPDCTDSMTLFVLPIAVTRRRLRDGVDPKCIYGSDLRMRRSQVLVRLADRRVSLDAELAIVRELQCAADAYHLHQHQPG